MKKEQIAVTMFTLRDFCKNEEEYADSLKKVSKSINRMVITSVAKKILNKFL